MDTNRNTDLEYRNVRVSKCLVTKPRYDKASGRWLLQSIFDTSDGALETCRGVGRCVHYMEGSDDVYAVYFLDQPRATKATTLFVPASAMEVVSFAEPLELPTTETPVDVVRFADLSRRAYAHLMQERHEMVKVLANIAAFMGRTTKIAPDTPAYWRAEGERGVIRRLEHTALWKEAIALVCEDQERDG